MTGRTVEISVSLYSQKKCDRELPGGAFGGVFLRLQLKSKFRTVPLDRLAL